VNAPNELRVIVERLLTLADGGAFETLPISRFNHFESDEEIDERYLASIAFALYASRRMRDRHLPGDLFGEPAWDMLLDLFVRGTQGKKTAVTSLCLASGVPATTALRWIKSLQDAGLVLREESEQDRRVAYLKLSASGFAALRRYLIGVARYLRPTRSFFMLNQTEGR
jgi:DNA-binding transcriptional ArsR family regulator